MNAETGRSMTMKQRIPFITLGSGIDRLGWNISSVFVSKRQTNHSLHIIFLDGVADDSSVSGFIFLTSFAPVFPFLGLFFFFWVAGRLH